MPQPNPLDALVQAGGQLYQAAAAVVTAVASAPGNAAEDVVAHANTVLETVTGQFNAMLGQLQELATTQPAPPPPIDANATLVELAKAITKAEQQLNQAGLSIVGASVELDFAVKIPNTPVGAQARMQVKLQPAQPI